MSSDFRELLRRKAVCRQMQDYIANFANPVRMKILCELVMGESTVGELVEATDARQSTVSQHLKHLRMSGLVARERIGNHRVYRVTDPLVYEMIEFFASISKRLVERGAFNASVVA